MIYKLFLLHSGHKIIERLLSIMKLINNIKKLLIRSCSIYGQCCIGSYTSCISLHFGTHVSVFVSSFVSAFVSVLDNAIRTSAFVGLICCICIQIRRIDRANLQNGQIFLYKENYLQQIISFTFRTQEDRKSVIHHETHK